MIIVKSNKGKSIYWLTKAAEQGYAKAQYTLGVHYYEGSGVDVDKAQAFDWFTKAAEQGYAEAQYRLGEYY